MCWHACVRATDLSGCLELDPDWIAGWGLRLQQLQMWTARTPQQLQLRPHHCQQPADGKKDASSICVDELGVAVVVASTYKHGDHQWGGCAGSRGVQGVLIKSGEKPPAHHLPVIHGSWTAEAHCWAWAAMKAGNGELRGSHC
jgi:hypothetical protein